MAPGSADGKGTRPDCRDDRLEPDGIVITKHGKPVAKVIPIDTDAASLIGSLKGKLRIRGDVSATGIEWDAES